MNTGIILQARLGSSRYPNKILNIIYKNKTILDLVIERLQLALPKIKLVVATTTNPIDNLLCDFLKDKKRWLLRWKICLKVVFDLFLIFFLRKIKNSKNDKHEFKTFSKCFKKPKIEARIKTNQNENQKEIQN